MREKYYPQVQEHAGIHRRRVESAGRQRSGGRIGKLRSGPESNGGNFMRKDAHDAGRPLQVNVGGRRSPRFDDQHDHHDLPHQNGNRVHDVNVRPVRKQLLVSDSPARTSKLNRMVNENAVHANAGVADQDQQKNGKEEMATAHIRVHDDNRAADEVAHATVSQLNHLGNQGDDQQGNGDEDDRHQHIQDHVDSEEKTRIDEHHLFRMPAHELRRNGRIQKPHVGGSDSADHIVAEQGHRAHSDEAQRSVDDEDASRERLRSVLEEIAQMKEGNVNEDQLNYMPSDHLVGLPLERDGHSNPDVHREAFFGKEMPQVDKMTASNSLKHLKILFSQADTNRDRVVDSTELSEWIHERGQEHLRQAQERNRADFAHVDSDHDHRLLWPEYARHIQHMKPADIKHHAPRRLSNTIWQELRSLNSDPGKDLSLTQQLANGSNMLHRLLVRDYQRWRNADMDRDGKLSEEEFFSFRHPEYNRPALMQFVRDMIAELDQNADGQLTVDEYADGGIHQLQSQRSSYSSDFSQQMNRKQRQGQYKDLIDVDGDGLATAEELEEFLDPMSAQSSINSALALIHAADDDHNDKLSWDEVVRHKDLLLHRHPNVAVQKYHNEL